MQKRNAVLFAILLAGFASSDTGTPARLFGSIAGGPTLGFTDFTAPGIGPSVAVNLGMLLWDRLALTAEIGSESIFSRGEDLSGKNAYFQSLGLSASTFLTRSGFFVSAGIYPLLFHQWEYLGEREPISPKTNLSPFVAAEKLELGKEWAPRGTFGYGIAGFGKLYNFESGVQSVFGIQARLSLRRSSACFRIRPT